MSAGFASLDLSFLILCSCPTHSNVPPPLIAHATPSPSTCPPSMTLPHRFKAAKLRRDDGSPSREQLPTSKRADATSRRAASDLPLLLSLKAAGCLQSVGLSSVGTSTRVGVPRHQRSETTLSSTSTHPRSSPTSVRSRPSSSHRLPQCADTSPSPSPLRPRPRVCALALACSSSHPRFRRRIRVVALTLTLTLTYPRYLRPPCMFYRMTRTV